MIDLVKLAGTLAALPAVLSVLVAPVTAGAADPESVRRDIERLYAVDVLGISRISWGERRLFSVRVMTPGSDDNDAWQVNELLVDPTSGRMVSGFQHRTSGYNFDGSGKKTAKTRSDGLHLIRIPVPETGRSLPVLRPADGEASGRTDDDKTANGDH